MLVQIVKFNTETSGEVYTTLIAGIDKQHLYFDAVCQKKALDDENHNYFWHSLTPIYNLETKKDLLDFLANFPVYKACRIF